LLISINYFIGGSSQIPIEKGTITRVKRKNGHKYRARLELPERGDDGKRKFLNEYFDKESQARLWLIEKFQEVYEGNAIDSEDIKLREQLWEWLEYKKANNLGESTAVRYEGLIENHINPELGDLELSDLSTRKIDLFYTKKKNSGRLDGEGGLSSTTVRQMHWILKGALDKAVGWDRLDQNPVHYVDVPEKADFEPESWSVREANTFLNMALGEKYFPIFKTAIETGMRRGEVLAMHWDSLDLESAVYEVDLALIETNHEGLVFTTPKSKHGERLVSLTSDVVELLREIKDEQSEKEFDVEPEYDLVFREPTGKFVNPGNLLNKFSDLIEKAGVPDIRFQDLRRTHATLARANGATLLEISRQLGHSDPSVTASYYQDVSIEDKRNVSDAIDDLFDADEN
jgi:integrase